MKYAIKQVRGACSGEFSCGTGNGSTENVAQAKLFDSEIAAVLERDNHTADWRSGTIIVPVKEVTTYAEA